MKAYTYTHTVYTLKYIVLKTSEELCDSKLAVADHHPINHYQSRSLHLPLNIYYVLVPTMLPRISTGVVMRGRDGLVSSVVRNSAYWIGPSELDAAP